MIEAADSQAGAKPHKPSRRGRVLLFATVGGALVVALLYAERGPIGARVARSWLQRQGIESSLVIEELGPGGFIAHGSLGPASDPDLTFEQAEVRFGGFPQLLKGGLAPSVESVRLVAPRLKARYDGRRLTFGSLQPLIDQALSRPSTGPAPAVEIERGELRLAAPQGALRLFADARLDQGRIERLDARLAPTILQQDRLRAELSGGTVRVRSDGDGLSATGRVDLARLDAAALAGRRLSLAFEARAPLDMAGAARASLVLSADSLTAAGNAFGQSRIDFGLEGALSTAASGPGFDGQGALGLSASAWKGAAGSSEAFFIKGPLTRLRLAREPQGLRLAVAGDLAGHAGGLRAAAARLPAADFKLQVFALEGFLSQGRGALSATPRLEFVAPSGRVGDLRVRELAATWEGGRTDLDWSTGGLRLSAPLKFTADVDEVRQPVEGGFASLRGGRAALTGRVGYDADRGLGVSLRGSARTQGGGLSRPAARRIAALVPVLSADPAGAGAVEQALSAIRLSAPDIAVALRDGRPSFTLGAPLEAAAASGARAQVSTPSVNAVVLQTWGGGLPTLDLRARQVSTASDRGGLTLSAEVDAQIGFTGDVYRGLDAHLAGRLQRRAGLLTFSAPACGTAALVRFGADRALVADLKAEVCADGSKPVFSMTSRGWNLALQARGLAFDAPDSQAQIRDGRAVLAMAPDRAGEASGTAVFSGRILDGAPMARYRPLAADGRAELAKGVWSGPLTVRDGEKGRALAEVRFRHDIPSATGHADIAAPALRFAKGGLQPSELSPIAAEMISDVDGVVNFTGTADWGGPALVSAGKLHADHVQLKTAAGQVNDAYADIVFTSLAPLLSLPDQPVGAASVDAVAPLEAPSARTTFKVDGLRVSDAKAMISGGSISLDALELPFDPKASVNGVVHADRIDLGRLIERFNLADKVELKAKISGTLPFSMSAGSLRLSQGRIFAIEPGRLTIRPEALSAAEAGAPGAPASNGVQTFAYQAMQDLAFDKLEAEVESRPMGRLGMVFRITGRHDPPKGGTTRIGILALLRGRAFDKPVDLPKGTPVNLVLDTSLNLDELLKAYAERSRSDSVQPTSSKP